MKLLSLTLQDFGLYGGTNRIVLGNDTGGTSKPVVLIGGRNGAGKTTMLEAVRLAFYGRRALGARVGKSEYETYLAERIHRSGDATGASVALEFDYAEAGDLHRYTVTRSWKHEKGGVSEALDIRKDGAAITSVPQAEWHHFLQELIPPGVSQLFFFDGEKIGEIADDGNDAEQLGEAVRGLLGIELVSRLRIDLGLYLTRHGQGDDDGFDEQLVELNRRIQAGEDDALRLQEDVAQLRTQRESQARKAEQVKRAFVSEGGAAARNRDKIENDLSTQKQRRGRAEHALKALAGQLLPFALAPKLMRRISEALDASYGSELDRSLRTAREALMTWRTEGKPEREAKWSEGHWRDLQRFIDEATSGEDGSKTNNRLESLGDGVLVRARLTELEVATRPAIVELRTELEKIEEEITGSLALLERANHAAGGVLLEELQEAERQLGATQATLVTRENEWTIARGQLVTLRRDRERLLAEQSARAKTTERAALAARTAEALAEYENKLLDHKLAQVRVEFVSRFNHLSRKDEFVSDIEIDRSTFATVLIDRDGNRIPKSALSSGEKQIYAIAMLWALARTSGRALPMIIDTPLARLDSEHRANLVERYFPHAAHQVILLSTDTEIDGPLEDLLAPHVDRAFELTFDGDRRRTTVSPGYFTANLQTSEEGKFDALQQA